MIIKSAGIILIVLCFSLAGMTASDRLKKYCLSCTLLEETAVKIGNLIRYRSLNVYDISSELKKSPALSEMEFIRELPEDFSGESFSDIWKRAVESDNSIGDEEKGFLIFFGEQFGTGDIQGQLSGVEMLIENLKIAGEKRRREYEKKGKLYRSVGLLAGIMTGIAIL